MSGDTLGGGIRIQNGSDADPDKVSGSEPLEHKEIFAELGSRPTHAVQRGKQEKHVPQQKAGGEAHPMPETAPQGLRYHSHDTWPRNKGEQEGGEGKGCSRVNGHYEPERSSLCTRAWWSS